MQTVLNIVTAVFKSKTLIVNYLALIAGTLTLWADSSVLSEHPQVVAGIATALAAINVVLRYVTVLPVSEK
jgi:hypothetical protein